MGSYVLRGITTALLVTVLTLFAGVLWGAMGLGGLNLSQLVDIGLLTSCLIGGYRTAKESGQWYLSGVTGAGYVVVGTLLLALFLPIRGLGFIQVLVEGSLLALVAGAFGAGKRGTASGTWQDRRSHSQYTPSYVGYDPDERRADSTIGWEEKENVSPTMANSSKDRWIDRSENNFEEIREIRSSDSIENNVIEWPWDRENKSQLTTRDPRQGQQQLVAWDKGEEKAKPWWEE